MKMIRPEQLAHLRSTYPRGTRVELVQMDDAQAPPMGEPAGGLGQRLRPERDLGSRCGPEGGGRR